MSEDELVELFEDVARVCEETHQILAAEQRFNEASSFVAYSAFATLVATTIRARNIPGGITALDLARMYAAPGNTPQDPCLCTPGQAPSPFCPQHGQGGQA